MSWLTNTNPADQFTFNHYPQPEQRSFLRRDVIDEKQRIPFQPRQSPIEQPRIQQNFNPINNCTQCNKVLVCYVCYERNKIHNNDIQERFHQSSLRNPRNVHFSSFSDSV